MERKTTKKHKTVTSTQALVARVLIPHAALVPVSSRS